MDELTQLEKLATSRKPMTGRQVMELYTNSTIRDFQALSNEILLGETSDEVKRLAAGLGMGAAIRRL